jgi:osmotically-inducible protein OsmY
MLILNEATVFITKHMRIKTMEKLNILNEVIRVSTTRAFLSVALLGIAVSVGLIGCVDGDSKLRTSRTAESEVERNFALDEARASGGNFDETQYEADNSGRNARDQNVATNTADDQRMGGNESEIVGDIRREIVANDDMSSFAKNVKIIIEDDKVTLRGPVDSISEKQWIERTTVENARNLQVDNQLEVRDPS